MTIDEAIYWFVCKLIIYDMRGLHGLQDDATKAALTALRAQKKAEKNDPLTLDELREMAQHGLAVWCDDMNGIAQGLLFMRKSYGDSRISPHICLIGKEKTAHIYHVEEMVK